MRLGDGGEEKRECLSEVRDVDSRVLFWYNNTILYIKAFTKMKTKLFGFVPFVLVLPIMFVGQNVAFSADTDCYYFTGDSAAHASFNTGYVDADYYGTACVNSAGELDGEVRSSNLGLIYLDKSDRIHSSASMDLADADLDGLAEWSGYAYAPLNPYLPTSSYGVWFDLSGVYTDLSDGVIYGEATNAHIGNLSFEDLEQEMPMLQVGISFSIETYGDIRADGLPVADGVNSGYRITAEIDLSEVPYAITEDFLDETFMFEGLLYADLGVSDLRLDQVTGGGSQNDAVMRDIYFGSYDIAGDIVNYYFDIGSYAPTSDAWCGDLDGDLESCGTSEDDYLYITDEIEIQAELEREFEWVSTGAYGVSTDVADSKWVGDLYEGNADVDFSEMLSFAPLYEIDDFGIEGVLSYSDMPTLTEGASYNFTAGNVVKNGATVAGSLVIPVDYYVDDPNYTFGQTGCGLSSVTVPGGVYLAAGGSLAAVAELTGIELCDLSGASELPEDPAAVAMASVYLMVGIDTKTVYYPSEIVEIADRSAGVQEPRVWVEGTVSGLYNNDDDVTTVGNLDRVEIRNAIFKEVSKVTNGVYESAGDGSVDLSSWYVSQGTSLSSDDVAYFFGDGDDLITIKGTTLDENFHKTIVIVGADAYVISDIAREEDGGELGIIVLQDEDGNGGDLYADRAVGDLHANIFLDGSLYRGEESGAIIQDEAFDGESLPNQFYIWGSLVSENTVGGYEEGCVLGDGEEGDCVESMQQDLEYTSYFEVCYPVVEGGEEYEECPGYERSEYTGDYWIHPEIIEYRPPEALPVFN